MNKEEDVKLSPSSLKEWTEIHLIETFKLTKRLDLREMIAIELADRIKNNNK